MDGSNGRPFFDLLPELYKQDRLMDAILRVFEEQYLKIEHSIDEFPERYDLDNYALEPAEDAMVRKQHEFLTFLWEMVGFPSDSLSFSYSQMRKLIPQAYDFHRQKGTRTGLSLLLGIYAGDICGHEVTPVIMDQGIWWYYPCSEEMKREYLGHVCGEADFTVFFPPEPSLMNPDVQAELNFLLVEYSPVDTNPHLEILGPEIRLGQNCYLGFSAYMQSDAVDVVGEE